MGKWPCCGECGWWPCGECGWWPWKKSWRRPRALPPCAELAARSASASASAEATAACTSSVAQKCPTVPRSWRRSRTMMSIEWRGALATRIAHSLNLQGAPPGCDSPRILPCIPSGIVLQSCAPKSPIDRTTRPAVAKNAPIQSRQVGPTKPEPAGNGGGLAAGGGGGWCGPQSVRSVPYWQFGYSASGVGAGAADVSSE